MNSDSDYKKFELQIELGDLHEKSGEIDKALEYFKSAYHIAVVLKDKKYEVDALVRIIEGYFHKGEIENSIKYAMIAEELLKDMDYVKGKLDISLYLLKVYSMKNQYYKAREIGNEALKLCTDEHITYKGRILNALASLYSELTSVDEHLEMLQQSLQCFESANCLRGTLGILNNIGVVYAEKVQDNEKALEYFFKLKERSEDSNYTEFNVFAYFNIGETYLKSLRYEEALSFCRVGLEKAKAAHMEAIVFYSYTILISINKNLLNYKDAYVYYKLATQELKNYPDQGESLAWYYKAAASLFLEFGEIHKANNNINHALKLLVNEERIIKWNTAITYECMKLKGAKNNTEILATLGGIKYILTKYKNQQVVLKIVYDVALELLNLNQEKLAFKLMDEYKHIETKGANEILKLKYIEALKCSNEIKKKMLKSALELAKEIQDKKLYIKICSSLGDCYFNLDDFENALSYYVDACKQVRDIIISVPEEFRSQFINSNGLTGYFNRMTQVKQLYLKKHTVNQMDYHDMGNEDELIKFSDNLDENLTTFRHRR